MLLNPFQHSLPVIPGTRMLSEGLGVIGTEISDPVAPGRIWTVVNLYAPVSGRKLNGIRARLQDQKEFVTFCNQRDLEVLIELAKPGDWCKWAGEEYIEPGERGWFGFCMDGTDLTDDLYERELLLRASYPGVPLSNAEITRRVHPDQGVDCEDLWILLSDTNESGYGPDTRFETLYERWQCASRDKLEWRRL